LPSTSFGPVQPFGVRRTIIGHSGRPVSPSSRAACWIAPSLVERGGQLLVHVGRPITVTGDGDRLVAVPVEQRLEFLLRDAGQHRRVGDLVAVELQDRR
jgi:hypothetical protein